ncbi:MAG: DUF2971 domain-containing protein [Clostridiales bacterium]|nr:DUF2971 domain-containing protein [Clostridiales bacterium]
MGGIIIKSILDEFHILLGLDISYMPKEYKNDIFHYTSPSGLDSILFEDFDGITLWASRYDCLNDMSEGVVAQYLYKEVCDDMRKKHEITDEMYSLIVGISPARTKLIVKSEEENIKFRRLECDRFVCSFSKNKDSLAMWNYYSKKNRYEGYNIGLTPIGLKKSLESVLIDKDVSIHIYPIVYKKDEQIRLIKKLLLRLQELYEEQYETSIRYVISNQLLEWSLVFKSEYFEHEEEIRIIVDVAKNIKGKPMDINYRNSHGLMIPYIKLKVDKPILKSVNIGPLQCGDKQKNLQNGILKERLSANNYLNVETCYSKIPVRY